jgi:hypothetical protein
VLFSMRVNFPPSNQALVVVLFGIIPYAVLNGRREQVGRIPQEFRGRLVAAHRDPCRADPAGGQLAEGAKRRQVAGVVTEITCPRTSGAGSRPSSAPILPTSSRFPGC